MRIVIVGMSNSIHLSRWIANLDGTGWDVHVIPVHPYGESQLTNVTVHDPDHMMRHRLCLAGPSPCPFKTDVQRTLLG
jgi:hypothetical protein